MKVPGDQDWYDADLATNSFGQGLSATPVQMAMAISALANDGKMMAPHIVRSLINNDRQYDTSPQVVGVPVSAETARTLTEMLAVSLETESSDALIDGYRVAGKTGTGEAGFEEQWHSWFAAYAPYKTDKPEERVVVVTMVEASENWEWWAPKAANLILHAIFSGESFEQTLATLRPWYAEAAARRIE